MVPWCDTDVDAGPCFGVTRRLFVEQSQLPGSASLPCDPHPHMLNLAPVSHLAESYGENRAGIWPTGSKPTREKVLIPWQVLPAFPFVSLWLQEGSKNKKWSFLTLAIMDKPLYSLLWQFFFLNSLASHVWYIWATCVNMQCIILLTCGSDGKEPPAIPWVGKIPWRREWLPLPAESLWTEEPGGLQSTGSQRDMTERLTLSLFKKVLILFIYHLFLSASGFSCSAGVSLWLWCSGSRVCRLCNYTVWA